MMKIKNGDSYISSQTLYRVFLLLILGMMIITGCINNAQTKQIFAEIMAHTNKNVSPDWHGIEPGKTTETEFGKIVSKDPDLFENLTKSHLRPEGTRYIWYDTESQVPIGVNFHDNIVSYLDFDLPRYGFPFEDILNIAGFPTAYTADQITEEFVSTKLLYEETGVVISFYVKFNPLELEHIVRNCKFTLSESTVADNISIYFIEQNNLESMISTLTTGVFTRHGEISEPWVGTEDVFKLTRCNP